MYDPERYRTKEEVDAWRERDPVALFTQRLLDDALATEADVAAIEEAIGAELDAAVAAAEAGTLEPVEDLDRFVYSERDDATPAPPPDADAVAEPAKPIRTTYREALRAALHDALERDERVFLMGEDVGRYGGCFAVSLGLLEQFGPERVRDTPLSESAFVGAGIGAALGGMRPIVEIMTVNFSLLALDQILNNAATLLHMSGGQFNVPLVIRMTTGAGRQLAAQHSHSLEGWYAHIPGLRIVAPATLDDARGMLWTALRDPDPVLIFEHGSLYNLEGELSSGAGPTDIDRAVVRRPGDDVSIVTYGGTLGKVLDAADLLARDGVSAEVIDLRSLRPLDTATIVTSVRRTHRAVIVDEGWRTGGLSAEVAATIAEVAFYDLDAPVERVCTAEVPIPYAKHLEDAALPQVADIVAAVHRSVGR
jgi:pyruvate/2-oxoglutarate/acetoin dehydrogenase E1 component